MKIETPIYHYHPDLLRDDDLVAGFIARQNDFFFLRDELAETPLEGNTQHYLLVGVRGSGKTTLLKRLAVAIRRDKELSDHLIAVPFPEELYQVKSLKDFWLAACENLLDEFDYLHMDKEADQLQEALESCPDQNNEDPLSDSMLEILTKASFKSGKRPVLLVDNLDMLFQSIGSSGKKKNNPHAPAYWALREALSKNISPVVIGGSVRLSDPFTDYDRAFYDFFVPKRLSKISLEDVKNILDHLSHVHQVLGVKKRMEANPGRIEALHELTGGNLRALGFIFEIIRQGPNGRAVDDFKKLIDSTTPYYKARIEDLSKQAQVIMHGLAVCQTKPLKLQFGYTAAELGKHCDLQTKTVSAQLDILVREGLVEKNASHGRTQYRICEQLFRLWLQMRGSRRIRNNVIGLTEFLEALYEPEELKKCLEHDFCKNSLARAQIAFAVAGTSHADSNKRSLIAHGTDSALQHAWKTGGDVEEYLPRGDLPMDLEVLSRLRDELHSCKHIKITKEEQDWLIGSLYLEQPEKLEMVKKLCQRSHAKQALIQFRKQKKYEYEKLLSLGLRAEDLPLLFDKRARGFLPLPNLMPEDADQACLNENNPNSCRKIIWRFLGARELISVTNEKEAQAWLEWGEKYLVDASPDEWANVAGTMRRCKCLTTAKHLLTHAEAKGEGGRVFYELAVFSMDIEKNYKKAEKYYKKAIALNLKDAYPWYGLGSLLADHLARYEEAEAAYNKAIQIDPKDAYPWHGLGNLLVDHLARYEEAEAAYRKAIEIDPKWSYPWYGLGNLLANHLALYEEAEAAYNKAIQIGPKHAYPWNNLGILLANHLARYEEAEAAYNKAIQIGPKHAYPWNNLGNLLANHLARYEEAEAAYRKAIEIDPKNNDAWFCLAELLYKKLNRLEEASVAYGQGAELVKDIHPYWRYQYTNLQTLLAVQKAKEAVREKNFGHLKTILQKFTTESIDIVNAVTSKDFVEHFLSWVLAKHINLAPEILEILKGAGYMQHARPLLLAFETVSTRSYSIIKDLEPEIQRAVENLYNRMKPEQF